MENIVGLFGAYLLVGLFVCLSLLVLHRLWDDCCGAILRQDAADRRRRQALTRLVEWTGEGEDSELMRAADRLLTTQALHRLTDQGTLIGTHQALQTLVREGLQREREHQTFLV